MEPLSIRRGKSRAINAENPTGEKGRGGMASSNLGKSRKGSPCLTNIAPGDEVVLADIQGAGVISHIWITVDDKTSEADRFVMRDLILDCCRSAVIAYSESEAAVQVYLCPDDPGIPGIDRYFT